jgi:hypothetical protein
MMAAPPPAPGRRLAGPAALVIGGLVLALMILEVPFARLAHQSLLASNGSAPLTFSAPFWVVGVLLAWQKPGNRIGWLILGAAGFITLSEDASFYSVADYRLHGGRLPLGWLALVAQPGWAPAIASSGLMVLLFPDGRLPSPRWRWALWPYLGLALLWVGGAVALFTPLRHRVQRAVDRRFNRARYDADAAVAAFAARLKGAVNLDSVRDDLAGTVHAALEPAQVSVWITGGGP